MTSRRARSASHLGTARHTFRTCTRTAHLQRNFFDAWDRMHGWGRGHASDSQLESKRGEVRERVFLARMDWDDAHWYESFENLKADRFARIDFGFYRVR